MSFACWLSSLSQPRRRPIRKATRRRTLLSIEQLEDRVVPSAASFNETFSSGSLPPEFERSGLGVGATCCGGTTGGSVFENGAVRFTGQDTRGDSSGGLRSFLRTIDADYTSVDFGAEVTVTIPAAPGSPNVGRNIVFFGLGTAVSGPFGGPTSDGIYLNLYPTNFNFGAIAVDGPVPTTQRDPNAGGNGTYRLRMEWSACTQSAVFSVDKNYVGGAFVSDYTLGSLNGSDNGFDATNARLFIGGDWNAVFDDFVVTASSPLCGDDTTTTVNAANATYDGFAHGATAVVTPGSPAGATTFLYTGTGDTVYSSSGAPINAGTYHVVANFTPANPSAFNPSSGFADYTIGKGSSSVVVSPTGSPFTYDTTTHTGGSAVVSGVGTGITQDVTWTYEGDQVNAGTYTAKATYAGDANHYGSDGSATMTVDKATLTGDATTQDALNMAKQGKLTITVSNVAGLANGDTLATFLSTAHYFITVGANQYEFVPTTVTTSGSSITIAYVLKDSALASSLAAELADNTSGSTAATAGFSMESANYTFTDDYLTRLFSTVK